MKITCKCSTTRNISELKEFQGDIKTITDKNLDKLIMLIETHGFSVPFIIWENNILDGHQRKKALTKMGYTGVVPVVEIHAENEKDAKEQLIGIASQHGVFNVEGLEDFTTGLSDLDSACLVDGPHLNLDFKVDLTPNSGASIKEDIEIVDSEDYEQAEVEEINTQVDDVINFPDGSVLTVGTDTFFAEETVRMWNNRNKSNKIVFNKKNN